MARNPDVAPPVPKPVTPGLTMPPWDAFIVPDPNTVKPPLSAEQRREMIAFIGLTSLHVHADLHTLPDDQLIGWYKTASVDWKNVLTHNGGLNGLATKIGTVTNATVDAITSPLDFLKLLAKGSTWVRVGEFTAGILLVGIAAHAVLRGNPGYQKAVASPVSKAARSVRMVK